MKTSMWCCNISWMKAGDKSGAILGMVLFIVLAISLVGIGLLQLGQQNAVEVSRSYNLSKAFWSAEAGLFRARARLLGDNSYRKFGSFPDVFPSPPGDYAVWVSKSNAEHLIFVISSTGMVHGATRVIQQSIQVEEGLPLAFNYSFFSGGTMKLANNIYVTGDGENGDIFADDGFSNGSKPPFTNNCAVYDGTSTNLPAPIPSVPILNHGYYSNLIAEAATSLFTNYPATLTGTNYVKNGIAISSSITGPGVLVVNGAVTISSATAAIGDGIMIIAKEKLSIGSTSSLGSNDVFYSETGIDISKENNFSDGNSVLITPGDISINKEFQFAGLIFAGGDIVFDKLTGTPAMYGCIVAGDDLTIKKDLNFIYDASQLPDTSDMFEPGPPTVTDLIWQQIF